MEQHQIDLETAMQKVFQDAYLFCVAAPLSGIMFGVVLPLRSVLLLDFSYSSLNEVKYGCVNYYSYCKSVLKWNFLINTSNLTLNIVSGQLFRNVSIEILEAAGMYTMGDVARMSVKNEDLLYRMFGINAELLIDHAWGWEPCTIADIKSYKPENNSISSGQVLQDPYEHDKAKLVVREMTDILALDLVEKRIVTD